MEGENILPFLNELADARDLQFPLFRKIKTDPLRVVILEFHIHIAGNR